MRMLLMMLACVILTGCAATGPRHYHNGIGKNPIVLTLNPTGDYTLRQTGIVALLKEDTGAWWLLQQEDEQKVVLLLSDQPEKPIFFARVSEQDEIGSLLGTLHMYSDLRAARGGGRGDLPPASSDPMWWHAIQLDSEEATTP